MKPQITIVSLGSGDPELMNGKTVRALREAGTLILRTGRHKAAEWLSGIGIRFSTLDHLYDQADDFDCLNSMISDAVLRQSENGPVVYAVADACTDHSVRTLLRCGSDSAVFEIIPGTGSYDEYLSSSLAFLPDTAVQVCPASDLSDIGFFNPNHSLLITELDNPILSGQIKIFLSQALDDDYSIILLRPSEKPSIISLYELDRQDRIDHSSAVLVPGTSFLKRSRFVMQDLSVLMDTLRSPEGCPWDRAQTHQTLRPYLIEEAWECVACIDQNDMEHLCEELGDLLFQIIFHSSIGKAFDEFTITDVISSICGKMIYRHPHVFGARKNACDADSVITAWEELKQEETGNNTLLKSMDDVSVCLPSLKYAAKILKKLNQSESCRRPADQVISEISCLSARLHDDPVSAGETEAARLLFLCSEYCFRAGFDSELLLHQAVDRLKSRLKTAENRIIKDGKSLEHLTFDELRVYLKHVEGEIE